MLLFSSSYYDAFIKRLSFTLAQQTMQKWISVIRDMAIPNNSKLDQLSQSSIYSLSL